MKKTTVKSVAVKTTKVTGAAISFAWTGLMITFMTAKLMDKGHKLVEAIKA